MKISIQSSESERKGHVRNIINPRIKPSTTVYIIQKKSDLFVAEQLNCFSHRSNPFNPDNNDMIHFVYSLCLPWSTFAHAFASSCHGVWHKKRRDFLLLLYDNDLVS